MSTVSISCIDKTEMRNIARCMQYAYDHHFCLENACNYVNSRYPNIDPTVLKLMWYSLKAHTEANEDQITKYISNSNKRKIKQNKQLLI